MSVSSFRVSGSQGSVIRGDIHVSDGHPRAGQATPVPVVVIVHGFKGFKDWGAWGPVAERFAANGLAAIRFDLSHNGVGEDGVDFSALELFETNSYSKEVADVEAVLAALHAGTLGPDVGPDAPVFLLGHSRGGADVLLVGSRGRSIRPAGVVTWASISDVYPSWADDHRETWERGESIRIPNLRTKQLMPIGPVFYEDLVRNRAAFDLERAVHELARQRTPLCVIHGTADSSVPLRDGQTIAGWARDADHPVFQLHEIEGGDHTFGAVHPFAGWTPQLEDAFDRTLEFIRRESEVS